MECKYRTIPFDMHMLEHLKQSASIFPSKYQRIYYVFSKSGFTEEVMKAQGEELRLINQKDLLLPS